jgi:type I restriction enzyme S subunit
MLISYVFESYLYNKYLQITLAGSTINNLKNSELEKFAFPFPNDIEEQQKIAAILSTVDEQISTIDKIIEKSKELKKGLMQKLFSEGIGHTEFKDTKVGRIPKDWEVKSLEEVGLIKVGRDLNKEIYNPTLSKEHKVRVYSNAITDRGLYGFYSRSEYPKNSITITGRGDIGYAFARNEEFGAIGRLIVIHPNSNVDYIYLTNYINHSVNFHIETSGIPQLTGVQASKYKVAIPPLPEQQKIAAILSEADAKIEKEQIQKAQLQALKKGLMQQLLTGKKRVNV